MPENLVAGNQRPEKGDHPAHNAAHCLDADLLRCIQIDVMQKIPIRLRQTSLGHKDKR
jgi:hypothetical protein